MFKRYFVDDLIFFKLIYMQMTGHYKNPLGWAILDEQLKIDNCELLLIMNDGEIAAIEEERRMAA